MYTQINAAAANYIDTQLADFEDTFAPVAPAASDEWLEIVISLVGLGITAIAAPFFDGGTSSLLNNSLTYP